MPEHDWDDHAGMTNSEVGLHLGYPPCCVLDFEHYDRLFEVASDLAPMYAPQIMQYVRPDRHLTGSGFVPCTWHQLNSDPDELVTYIKTHRECSIPWEGGGLEESA